jgi:hypothetical protein
MGAPFPGIPKDMGRMSQRMDITVFGGPAGEFAGGSSAGDLRRLW